jgi:hypothetical protein
MAQPTVFALPIRTEAGYSDPASQTLHVYLYAGSNTRLVMCAGAGRPVLAGPGL